MKLVLKSNNEQSIARIIALAKKLDVIIEKKTLKADKEDKVIKERILNFKATAPSSFGDAENWQREERKDRNLGEGL